MNKWLIIIIAMFIFPISSCAIMDRPELSAKEVTALVHQHCLQSNDEIQERVANMVTNGEGEWVADYQGNGIWSVTCTAIRPARWEFYENTSTIIFLNYWD